jgi:ABC-type Fe3+-hydroxamate transport system substrate-binding protein
MVRDIGAVLHRPGEAERIAADIERRAARVRSAAAGAAPVRYAYLIWRDPWMVAAGDTFVAAMLALPGGVNVFADRDDRYPAVTAAEIADAAPDVVFLSSEPFPFKEKHLAELAAATGIPPERFRFVDGEMLTWHGSRTPAGVDYAERVMVEVRTRATR